MILHRLAKYFGIGLATVLPFAFVIWVIVFIFDLVDGLFGEYVDRIQGIYIPGIGFLMVIIGITLIGAMSRLWLSRTMLGYMDVLFTKIPVVKSLYTMAKELVENFMGKRKAFRRVVLVEWPDERALVIGFVTNEELPGALNLNDHIAVYLPNTFQVAGITVLIPRSRVQNTEMSVEEALKFSLSAGLGSSGIDKSSDMPTSERETESEGSPVGID